MNKHKTLHDRCADFLAALTRNNLMRQGSPVADLMAFVNAEKGRDADDSLKDALPLILYFGSEADREEFMALVREIKPNMMAKKIP